MLREALPANRFLSARVGDSPQLRDAGDYARLPFTAKSDLVADQQAHGPFGRNLTYPVERYTNFHQTSGTTGRPLRVLDTTESWDWWGRCWVEVLRASGVRPNDRVFFAFSFAPFIGFWSAYHGVAMLGAMAISGGGMDSRRRLGLLAETGSTILLCTPTYALHLAEVARKEGVSTTDSSIRLTIHAGEPGGSVPEVRRRISEAWGARVFDHAGASEIGAFGVPDSEGRGVVLNEAEFIAEVIEPASGEALEREGEGELVLTNLGRIGWPVVRYRTGDIVRARRLEDGRLLLEGGVLGRVDEMITVRGVNVYPAALENIIRGRSASGELRITARRDGEMDEISIELEADAATCRAVAEEIHDLIGLRASVEQAADGSLPRFELKSRRFRDLR